MPQQIPTEGPTVDNNAGTSMVAGDRSTDNQEYAEGTAEDDKEDSTDPWDNCKDVCEQIKLERQVAIKFLKPKWDKWLLRLKLYNNQRRSRTAIGDPLIFSIHQTVIASLYTDELAVEFQGRTKGDADQAENLTMLAKFDAEEMEKEKLDYDWIWDTGFFGWGLMLMQEFDRETLTPVPEVIDPFSVMRDPRAVSPNGDKKGRGAARFLGREIRMAKYKLKEAGVYDDDGIKSLQIEDSNLPTDPIQLAAAMRQEAQGYTMAQSDGLVGDSADHVLWEWWTYWQGQRWFFTVGNNGTTLLRAEKVPTKKWPFVKRSLFPMAHDWDGVSIPDLVEDKQRARATLTNLGLKSVRANLYPNYLYNNQLIKNKAALAKFEFNKFTGVAGQPQNAVWEIPRANIKQDVQWILDLMNGAAQDATATPDIKQGAAPEKVKSATETAQVTQGVETRYGLVSKVFGWSEKDLWRLWYENYDLYFKDAIDSKVVRLSGTLGPTWHELSRTDLIGGISPSVSVESKSMSDAKRMNRMNMDIQFMNQGMAMDPGFNKRFAVKNLGSDMGYSSDELNRYLPKTFDEWEAEQENVQLSKNEIPKISMAQNHQTHIAVHTLAEDTPAKMTHIQAHYAAMWLARKLAAAQAQEQQKQQALAAQNAAANGNAPPGSPGGAGGPPQPGAGAAPGGPGAPDPMTGQPPMPMATGAAVPPQQMNAAPLQLQAPNAVQAAQ